MSDGTKEKNEDDYGNDIDSGEVTFCCFPDCGCDGARLCMAKNGASDTALRCNVEGMYRRTDKAAIRGRMETLAESLKRKG
jgi:hypothetical protein